jgi:hypothetical protein
MTSNVAASEYFNQGTDSDRGETPLIVNDGHYMTRGHVVLCLLYIRMRRNVKKYFGAGKRPFSGMRTGPVQGIPPFFPAAADAACKDRRPYQKDVASPRTIRWGRITRISHHLKSTGVFFLTHRNGFLMADFAPILLRSPGQTLERVEGKSHRRPANEDNL